MILFERLAEERIQKAIERGDLDNLPGAGKPIPREEHFALVPPDLRMAYRILKNAGIIPEEVQLRGELDDITRLLQCIEAGGEEYRRAERRLQYLRQRLGERSAVNIALEERYLERVTEKLVSAGGGGKQRQHTAACSQRARCRPGEQ